MENNDFELPPVPAPETTPVEAPKNEKTYGIVEPRQMRQGGWIGQVINPANKEILYEHVEFSKHWAFVYCYLWVLSQGEII
jgi:hypothetical protein